MPMKATRGAQCQYCSHTWTLRKSKGAEEPKGYLVCPQCKKIEVVKDA